MAEPPEITCQRQKQMRAEIHKHFAHILPEARIIEDISGEGQHTFRNTQLWKDGPTWNEIPVFGKPEDPCTEGTKVWDFWPMEYNPQWNTHLFWDCPLNSIGKGKGLCPSLSQKSKVKEEVQQYGARGGQDRAGARGDVGRGQPLELDWYRRIPGGGEGGALWLRST